jgi:gamma-glutamylcyclotransferase (GGCT)/AIG2-like uncharacterized protein YtfP
MNKKLIAVYGSLRKGFHNHGIIKDAKYLGTCTTEPTFSLYSLGGFPGLKQNGNTPVVIEVYEVNNQEAYWVDALEGYSEQGNNTFYDKIFIDTPYGEASIYIYVPNVTEDRLVKSGDWTEHKKQLMYT